MLFNIIMWMTIFTHSVQYYKEHVKKSFFADRDIFTLNKLSIINIITVSIIVDIMMIIIKIPCVRQTDGRVVDKLGPEQTNGAKQME